MHLQLWYLYFQITLHGSCTNSYSYQQSTRSWLNFKKMSWFSIARISVVLRFQQIAANSVQLGQLPAPLVHIDLLWGYKAPTPMRVLKFLNMPRWGMMPPAAWSWGVFPGLLPSQLWDEIQTFCRGSISIRVCVEEKENEVKEDCSRTVVSVNKSCRQFYSAQL